MEDGLRLRSLFAFIALFTILVDYSSAYYAYDDTWPQPHRQYAGRPNSSDYCQAGVIPFCPTGLKSHFMPHVEATDTLFVYALKAPVWEFKFGDLLGKFNIWHDAMGFHHVQSGLNFTMEWYELFQLFNCTFPHEPKPDTLLWCNQGATCIYPGIDEKHWKENGTLVKVSEISGTTFNNFSAWVEKDNNTFPFYETWTVMDKPGGQVWFNPFDCASWVLRAFDNLNLNGAHFNQSIHLNYTKAVLYSSKPKLVGNSTSILTDDTLRHKLYDFYHYFQGSKSYATVLEHLVEYFARFMLNKDFYLFYNDQYWLLNLTKPYLQLTYDEVPLPSGTHSN